MEWRLFLSGSPENQAFSFLLNAIWNNCHILLLCSGNRSWLPCILKERNFLLILVTSSCRQLFHFFSETATLRTKLLVCAKHPNPVNFNIMQGVSARWEIISIGCTGSASPVQENFSVLGQLCRLGGTTMSCKGRT